MLNDEGRIVASMAVFRFLSAAVEFTAAVLMLRFRRVDTAFQINAALGLFGPIILIAVSALGLVGLAGKISYGKLGLLIGGVALILIAARR